MLFFTILIAFGSAATAWYLPGSAPVDYVRNASIALKVNKMTSSKTQLPFGFYHLPYCQPDAIVDQAENLGEILKGDKIQNSPFEVKMLTDESCKLLCFKKVAKTDIEKFISAIDDEYFINIMADNLPAAMSLDSPKTNSIVTMNPLSLNTDTSTWYSLGLPVGVMSASKQHVLMNHWDFQIKYQRLKLNNDLFRIVGFLAKPSSLKQERTKNTQKYPSGVTCESSELLILDDLLKQDEAEISFTYSVSFHESDEEWSSRWNNYFTDNGDRPDVHWFSIINAVMIVLLLSGLIALILLRTLLRDIARYNQLDDVEDAQEEFGWKLVHGDVFRRPNHSKLLAVCAGTGVQLISMILLTLILAVLGFLSPANRGSLVQAGLILFALMGAPAGYTSARFNKLFDGDDTTRNLTVTTMTALLFPGVCFTTFFILNIVLRSQGSTGAAHFGTMFLLLLIWFGISLPLVFLGSHYGYKKASISMPVRTNQIPRQIPPSHWLFRPLISHGISGMLPFCAVFTELLFILGSVWQHRFYYLFGFVLLVVLILIITCAEISIAFVYFQLCAENYQWWWRSYWASASAAVYFFLYGVFYFFTRLSITKLPSIILYFGYTALMSYAFFLLTGAIGFISAFFFVRAIYGAVKVD